MSTQLEAWCGHLCRIKANTGAIVRATHELDSPVVGELKCGVNVRVWESGFSKGKDGKTWTGRCKVMHPHVVDRAHDDTCHSWPVSRR